MSTVFSGTGGPFPLLVLSLTVRAMASVVCTVFPLWIIITGRCFWTMQLFYSISFYSMHVGVLPAFMSVITRMPGAGRPDEVTGSPGTRVTNCGDRPLCWELNLCLLEEQPVLLPDEPRLQSRPLCWFLESLFTRNLIAPEHDYLKEPLADP